MSEALLLLAQFQERVVTVVRLWNRKHLTADAAMEDIAGAVIETERQAQAIMDKPERQK